MQFLPIVWLGLLVVMSVILCVCLFVSVTLGMLGLINNPSMMRLWMMMRIRVRMSVSEC